MLRTLALVWLLASLGASAPGEAQELLKPFSEARGLVTMASAELSPLTARELVAGSESRPLASFERGRRPFAAFFGGQTLVREIPALWQLRISPDIHPSELDVQYEISSPDGRRNRLQHAHDRHSEIGVRVVDLPPTLVRTKADHVVVQGGISLELSVDRVRSAGTYRGHLIITVSQF